jgi:hypothetical protein
MRPPSPVELLTAWEDGAGRSAAERSLALLRIAMPGSTREELERLSVGRRDAALLTLRESVFGRRLSAHAVCPGCSERLEFGLDSGDLRAGERSEAARRNGIAEISVRAGEHLVRCRPLCTSDLLAAEAQTEADEARSVLISRCILSAETRGRSVSPLDLPPEVVAEVSARMAEADPQADVVVSVACPSCSREWRVAFDIVSFFWRELSAWGSRMLHEIHTLASAYGWSERQILEISPARRRAYVELAAG